MSSPMQALPTYSQWKEWCGRRRHETWSEVYCTYCLKLVELFRDNLIRVGCRVKVWDEQITETAEGEVVKLTSKIVPMSITGPGCPECQYLMTKLESEELGRYEKACREWHELHKPHITAMDIHAVYCGRRYRLVKAALLGSRWLDENGVRVPTSMESMLHQSHQETCEQTIAAGLEPWMRALGLTAPPFQPQPDSQTRTPSKRQVYIDVTEAVLAMPRAKVA